MERQQLPQDHWLAQTKLQRPRLRKDIVPRQRLLDLLHQAVAAHGKTTLATGLARSAADLRFTWLALDMASQPAIGISWRDRCQTNQI